MNLADEFAEGFNEGAAPMATAYTLTNDSHSGVIRATGGGVALTEPGYEPKDGIIIVEAMANFTRPPAPELREIVQVLDGQFKGKWVLVGCVADNANYTMTCQATE
ncbi:MAG TPA: hypothetical protein VHN11_21120 [Xanthobacteraceae bacterium]|jgi:hypothetical protein|nr:hypothetical protein [Xanthobacteraceae bacterium]